MKIHVMMSVHASVSVPVEIPDAVIDEITGGVPFDGDNEEHLNGLADVVWEYDIETPTLCAQCTGWGKEFELELGDNFDVVGAYPEGT